MSAMSRVTTAVFSMLAGFALLVAGVHASAQLVPRDPGQTSNDQGSRYSPLTQVGNMEVLSEHRSADLGPYLRSSVMPSLRGNWQWVVRTRETALSTSSTAPRVITAEFAISKDGDLQNPRITESSGEQPLDDTVLDALRRSNPFAALPQDFSAPLELRCSFYYRAGRGILFDRGGVKLPGPYTERRPSDGVIPPRVTYSPDPPFSDKARKKRVQGIVILTVTVTASGDVGDVKVVQGLGSGLDEQAVNTVRTWKFQPATKNGEPVQAEVPVEISFHLQ